MALSLKTTLAGGQPRQGDTKPGGVAVFLSPFIEAHEARTRAFRPDPTGARQKANRPSGGYGRLRSAVEQAGSDQDFAGVGRAVTVGRYLSGRAVHRRGIKQPLYDRTKFRIIFPWPRTRFSS